MKVILRYRVIQYPSDTQLKPKAGVKDSISWHYRLKAGSLNLYNTNDAEQLEQVYQKLMTDIIKI